MNFVNLTPHSISFQRPDGTVLCIEPSGGVARCLVTSTPVGEIEGIQVITSTFGDVTGLPEPSEGVVYLVSSLVLSGIRDRDDVMAPDDFVRDGSGRIIGARALRRERR
jgi:hypothetical protein